jgi:hypothetical protein
LGYAWHLIISFAIQKLNHTIQYILRSALNFTVFSGFIVNQSWI